MSDTQNRAWGGRGWRGCEGVWGSPGRDAGEETAECWPGERHGDSAREILIIIKPQPLASVPWRITESPKQLRTVMIWGKCPSKFKNPNLANGNSHSESQNLRG